MNAPLLSPEAAHLIITVCGIGIIITIVWMVIHSAVHSAVRRANRERDRRNGPN